MTPQVVWSNPFGDIFLDADIKLFEFEDIQKYSGYNDPPKSKEFCRFYTSSSSKVQWEFQMQVKYLFSELSYFSRILMGLTPPSSGQQVCCGSSFPPVEWRPGTETLENWYPEKDSIFKTFESGWTLQELERVGAHGAQLEQGRGAKEEGGGEEGRLCQRSKVMF